MRKVLAIIMATAIAASTQISSFASTECTTVEACPVGAIIEHGELGICDECHCYRYLSEVITESFELTNPGRCGAYAGDPSNAVLEPIETMTVIATKQLCSVCVDRIFKD